jgi:NhaP-type Na+/H+ and K+/H+ antiporter
MQSFHSTVPKPLDTIPNELTVQNQLENYKKQLHQEMSKKMEALFSKHQKQLRSAIRDATSVQHQKPNHSRVNDILTQMIQDLIKSQKETVNTLITKSQNEMIQYDFISENTAKGSSTKLKLKYAATKMLMHEIIITIEDLFQRTLAKSIFAPTKEEQLSRYSYIT